MTILQQVQKYLSLCNMFVKNVVSDFVQAMNGELGHSVHTQICNGYGVLVFVKVKTVPCKPYLKDAINRHRWDY